MLGLIVAGCGDGDGGLSKSEVMNIPAGNAQGSDHSGQYLVEVYTSDCSGACSAEAAIFTLEYCDVGDRDDEAFEATQNDGEIRMDGDLIASRLEGGIDRDGTFDVGGYGTDGGGDIQTTIRFEGEISDDGKIEGISRAHIWGSVDGDRVDCSGTYDVSGARIGE